MNICSFVPGATEILFALGLDDEIVGVSHECDWPVQARQKPQITSTAVRSNALSSHAINAAVRRRERLYTINESLLQHLAPDLVVAQQLCNVCAVDPQTVAAALRALARRPQVLWLHPHSLTEVFSDIRQLGDSAARPQRAQALLASLQGRLARVRERIAQAQARPRVFCLEWLEPPMASGHWVPEQVERAGGAEVLGWVGEPSRTVTWEEIAAAQPEVMVLMPCGFSIERTRRELHVITQQPEWDRLPAVREGRVLLADGSAYFSRSGPRLIEGIEMLAGVLHPERCGDLIPSGSVEPLADVGADGACRRRE